MAIANVGESQSFGYTGGMQTFTAQVSGVYKLEAIGARGGICAGYGTATNGLGGYGMGYVMLKKGETIYICVGGQGTGGGGGYGAETRPAGGYNGGGAGGFFREWVEDQGWRWGCGAGGGGATHFARASGTLAELGAKTHLLLVAGGGGGEVKGSTNNNAIGNGGGESGTAGANSNGGTQSGGYAFGQGQDGFCSNEGSSQQGNGGAGGGLYGGYTNQYAAIPYGGAGGSGYIGGVPAFSYKNVSYAPSWTTGYSGATGNGSAKITFMAKGELPVSFNGTTLEKLVFNGTEVTSLIMNGTKVFMRKVRQRVKQWMKNETESMVKGFAACDWAGRRWACD